MVTAALVLSLAAVALSAPMPHYHPRDHVHVGDNIYFSDQLPLTGRLNSVESHQLQHPGASVKDSSNRYRRLKGGNKISSLDESKGELYSPGIDSSEEIDDRRIGKMRNLHRSDQENYDNENRVAPQIPFLIFDSPTKPILSKEYPFRGSSSSHFWHFDGNRVIMVPNESDKNQKLDVNASFDGEKFVGESTVEENANDTHVLSPNQVSVDTLGSKIDKHKSSDDGEFDIPSTPSDLDDLYIESLSQRSTEPNFDSEHSEVEIENSDNPMEYINNELKKYAEEHAPEKSQVGIDEERDNSLQEKQRYENDDERKQDDDDGDDDERNEEQELDDLQNRFELEEMIEMPSNVSEKPDQLEKTEEGVTDNSSDTTGVGSTTEENTSEAGGIYKEMVEIVHVTPEVEHELTENTSEMPGNELEKLHSSTEIMESDYLIGINNETEWTTESYIVVTEPSELTNSNDNKFIDGENMFEIETRNSRVEAEVSGERLIPASSDKDGATDGSDEDDSSEESTDGRDGSLSQSVIPPIDFPILDSDSESLSQNVNNTADMFSESQEVNDADKESSKFEHLAVTDKFFDFPGIIESSTPIVTEFVDYAYSSTTVPVEFGSDTESLMGNMESDSPVTEEFENETESPLGTTENADPIPNELEKYIESTTEMITTSIPEHFENNFPSSVEMIESSSPIPEDYDEESKLLDGLEESLSFIPEKFENKSESFEVENQLDFTTNLPYLKVEHVDFKLESPEIIQDSTLSPKKFAGTTEYPRIAESSTTIPMKLSSESDFSEFVDNSSSSPDEFYNEFQSTEMTENSSSHPKEFAHSSDSSAFAENESPSTKVFSGQFIHSSPESHTLSDESVVTESLESSRPVVDGMGNEMKQIIPEVAREQEETASDYDSIQTEENLTHLAMVEVGTELPHTHDNLYFSGENVEVNPGNLKIHENSIIIPTNNTLIENKNQIEDSGIFAEKINDDNELFENENSSTIPDIVIEIPDIFKNSSHKDPKISETQTTEVVQVVSESPQEILNANSELPGLKESVNDKEVPVDYVTSTPVYEEQTSASSQTNSSGDDHDEVSYYTDEILFSTTESSDYLASTDSN